jgi:serine/threonine protein kinase
MTTPSADRGPSADALAARLVQEMVEGWRRGARPLAEDFLERHPELRVRPEAAIDLIYEELCLRQEHGQEVSAEELLARFPQWRAELELLLDCQRLLGPPRLAPPFPAAGESFGEFRLVSELGRGSEARVFLARQTPLGDRPVVLKLTAGEAQERLALARLQHTHIVPLYSAQDHPARGLRALCMPYLGGATLAQLLAALRPVPPARRTGRHLLDALDRARPAPDAAGPAPEPTGPVRRALAGASYVQAVCWMGACLADALNYAHERGLVHLDLKPSNVLLAADAQPMVLDFHLACEPVHPGGPVPPGFGGTPGYMSPEQQAALQAIRHGQPVPRAVDGRSDVYALGVVLYEALAGDPSNGAARQPLCRLNPQVSAGLADIVSRCLAAGPRERYPDMAALATDLRRHLGDLPLVGVRNRLTERWRKWRRRRPQAFALVVVMLAALLTAAAVAIGAAAHAGQRAELARAALHEGRSRIERGQWADAAATLRRGLALARGLPFRRDLTDELERQLRQAESGQAVADRAAAVATLHGLADRARFLYGADHLPAETLRGLEAPLRAFWGDRDASVALLRPVGAWAIEPTVRDDLLDLAIFWADFQVHRASPASKPAAHGRALAILAEAEERFGPNPVLDAERRFNGVSGPAALPTATEGTAWHHYALGRALLRCGDLERADEELTRAVRAQPSGLWPNYYQGLCAYRRGRYADAVTAFSVCIGAAPEAAACFFHRGRAFDALGRAELALRDYGEALRLDPTLAAAALHRGMVHYRAGSYAAALEAARRALHQDPDNAEARKLLDEILKGN